MGWAIERDAKGQPVRMWWGAYGFDRPPLDLRPLAALCPRCRSPRWCEGRCLDCWYHASDAKWPRR